MSDDPKKIPTTGDIIKTIAHDDMRAIRDQRPNLTDSLKAYAASHSQPPLPEFHEKLKTSYPFAHHEKQQLPPSMFSILFQRFVAEMTQIAAQQEHIAKHKENERRSEAYALALTTQDHKAMQEALLERFQQRLLVGAIIARAHAVKLSDHRKLADAITEHAEEQDRANKEALAQREAARQHLKKAS